MSLQLRNIGKTYKMLSEDIPALHHIDLTIDKNEYLAIMGPSGSGKSTLMNILGCLDTATTGDYLLDNENVSLLNDDQLAAIRNQKIGFVFQTFNLLPRSNILQNVELPLVYMGVKTKERKLLAEEAIEKVGLLDRINHKPNELSGGQRQRVAIARALVNKPTVILADEPTGNLDSKNSQVIHNLFVDLKNKLGLTFLVVSHNPELIKLGEQVFEMKDGSILTRGNP